MKKHLLKFPLILLGIMLLQINFIQAQQVLNQVIIASGGAFSDPTDFVTLSTLDPITGNQSNFDTIYTQAVQKMHVNNNQLFVTATDSLVVYNLENMQRMNTIAVSGPNFVQVVDNKIFMTIQYPETSGFLRIFDAESMALENTIDQISGETAGMLLQNDRLFVAVPGDYFATTGSLAVIDAQTGAFVKEVNLGGEAIGIYSLFAFENKIVAVCKSAWGTSIGNILVYNPSDDTYSTYSFDHALGKGIAVDGNILYLIMDNGIGSVDLVSMQVINNQIVEDPGSVNFVYFADVAFDELGHVFYATVSDYFSFGQGYIYTIDGDETSEFDAGISPEAIAFDYRTPAFISVNQAIILDVYPNPANRIVHINAVGLAGHSTISLIDMQGRTMLEKSLQNMLTWQLDAIPSGVYFLRVATENQIVSTQKIIVNH